MKKAPCKGCEERHSGCHAECESYIDWKKEHEEENEKIRADGEAWRAFYDVRKKHMSKEDKDKFKYGKK